MKRYRVIKALVPGGAASVELAELRGPDGFIKEVVIKRPHRQALEETDAASRFVDEARLLSHLQHPNIAQVLEFGVDERGHFLVLEYIEGVTVRALALALRAKNVRCPVDVALALLLQAGAGLHQAHETKDASGHPLGIIHRDVSPQNIIVSRDGHVKWIDFGLAWAKRRLTSTEHTRIYGKYRWLSPEAATLQPLDRRTDLFGLALVFYELLIGQDAYPGNTQETLLERAKAAELPLLDAYRNDVTRELVTVFARALAREPSARFATVQEFCKAVARAAEVADEARCGAWLRPWFPRAEQRTLVTKTPVRKRRWPGLLTTALSVAAVALAPPARELEQIAASAQSPPAQSPPPHSATEPPPPQRMPRHAPGYLSIGARPWASVTIDGKRLGKSTPIYRHPLPAGPHELTVHCPSRTVALTINIKEGEVLTHTIDCH